MKPKIISLDAMGGDHGISVIIPAAIQALEKHDDLQLILVGDEAQIRAALPDPIPSRISITHTTEVVGMDELPSMALRSKKDSSMRVAINLVKEGKADACVSAGNTGALMATARFVLKMLPGIDRPAIITELPTVKGNTRILDLGANVDSSAEHLFQFAVMGSVLASEITRDANPRVALLNIGSEEIKGNDVVKAASQKLVNCPDINFTGYIEGDKVFQGHADVVVCDGFVGNVALKTTEGVAKLFMHSVKQVFLSSALSKLIAFIAKPFVNQVSRKLDPTRYNGASLLGLNGIVIKSHGGADAKGFRYAIDEAMREIEHDVPSLIRSRIAEILEKQA